MGNEIFGFDEEMNEEKTEKKEALNSVRKPYVEWVVGNKEYKLKLTTHACVKLEEKYKRNLLLVVTEEGLPPIAVILTVIQAAMTKYHHGITLSEVMDIYDEYVDCGGDVAELMADVILPLLGNAGFFTENQTEELKADLKKEL